MNRSESISKLAISLVKFNSEVSSISKDAKNPFFKSEYVTLDNLIHSTRDILQKNGLVVMQSPLSKDDGSIGIQTLLIHESGEFIESEPIFMKPAKANDPQQAGSIISYMRRYSYQAILNLNTGEDDDANRSSNGLIGNDEVDKLYKLAYAKGIKRNEVDELILQRKGKSVTQLEKGEYAVIYDYYKGLAKKFPLA